MLDQLESCGSNEATTGLIRSLPSVDDIDGRALSLFYFSPLVHRPFMEGVRNGQHASPQSSRA
jgi:hypothetical protein